MLDATVGAGAHAELLLDSGVATVVGLDRDPSALREASSRLERFGERFRAARARFSRLSEAAARLGIRAVGGVLFDLGVSSMQLDQAQRGFGYRASGPLDMRMGRPEEEEPPPAQELEEGAGSGEQLTAGRVVNEYSEHELARVIFEYGEERYSRRIAGAIVRARDRAPLRSTEELAAIVAGAVPRRRGGPHPARRTFQALRIEVNAELEELAASLPQAVSLLEPSGRLVVISYHSLEDRIVKRFLLGEPRLQVLTRKPVRPGTAEMGRNPRARSARLRAAELVARADHREEAA